MRVNKSLLIVLALITINYSCGLFGGGNGQFADKGELIGVPDRIGWEMVRPFGMVLVPTGTFHMGQADEDVAVTQVSFNRQVTIGSYYIDDTEITNNEYRQFVNDIFQLQEEGGGEFAEDGAELEVFDPGEMLLEDLKPDTTVWLSDFTHHMGDPLFEYYWDHAAFDDYPVVGVSWVAARHFANWRSIHLNNYRRSVGLPIMPRFRLPSEAEWEYAARGGRDMAKYPWGSPYIRNAQGCLLANFKPGRGNYYDDGYAYTAPVNTYFANEYGIYDMSGNVSEWCEDAYNRASSTLVWDLNPTYYDENTEYKVVRGGSWKDIAYFLETGTKTFEHKDSTRTSIGFRCALTYLGRSSGNEF